MLKESFFSIIKNNLIVSCQDKDDIYQYGMDYVVNMAKAAASGGASALLVDTPEYINAVNYSLDIPVIGMNRKEYKGSDCSITASMKEVSELIQFTRTEIVYIDATDRLHPDGDTGAEFIREIKNNYPNITLICDISSFDEAIKAFEAGADMLATSLSREAINSKVTDTIDFELIDIVSSSVDIPVIATGNIWTPSEASQALSHGAYSVIVGSAITKPVEITKRFANVLNNYDSDK